MNTKDGGGPQIGCALPRAGGVAGVRAVDGGLLRAVINELDRQLTEPGQSAIMGVSGDEIRLHAVWASGRGRGLLYPRLFYGSQSERVSL